MWIVFERATRKIIGFTGHGSIELSREAAIGNAASSLDKDDALLDAILIEDDATANAAMLAYPERRVEIDGEGKLVIKSQSLFTLSVSSDAPDVHPVDGIPEIPADGRSSTLIVVQKLDSDGALVRGNEHTDELYLRTDHGTLQDEASENDVSRVRLKSGIAKFRLKSEQARRVATVQVFNADRAVRDASIRIEFV